MHTASHFSASQFLKTYEDEFFDVVSAKFSLLKLKRKGVISADVKADIQDANDDDAKEILYSHLESSATVNTLREYCNVATAAEGLPRMQKLGQKMLKRLGGWLELCLFGQMGRCWCSVGECMSCRVNAACVC